jgi:hypothetical protein
MLLCRIAAIHCALGAGFGVTQLVLIVAVRCFAMVFGRFFMGGRSLFVEVATCMGSWHDESSFISNIDK